jgi:hypothetical protein
MNENYHQEYQRLVLEAQQLTHHLADLLERMEDPKEGERFHRQDPHADMFRKHREHLERLHKVIERYFEG